MAERQMTRIEMASISGRQLDYDWHTVPLTRVDSARLQIRAVKEGVPPMELLVKILGAGLDPTPQKF